MTARYAIPNSPLLTDANIVIEAYRVSAWDQLIHAHPVAVPSIVIEDEAIFYDNQRGEVPTPIRLADLVRSGRIDAVEASMSDLDQIRQVFDDVFLQCLDPGEMEALAIMKRGGDYLFCTADGPALRALAMLGLSEKGISLEKALAACGLTKPIRSQYMEKFFRDQIAVGQTHMIQGVGLRPKDKRLFRVK